MRAAGRAGGRLQGQAAGPQGDGRLTLRSAWPAACAVLAAVLQVGFVLELLLPGSPSVTRSQISELSAPGQQWELVFRAFDVASGLLVLAVVPGWWRVSRAVGGALAFWGVGLAVAALWSASCADTLHPGCAGNGLPGPGTGLRDNLHDIGSIASVFGLLFAVLAAGLVLRSHGHLRRGTLVLALWAVCSGLGLFESAEDVIGVSALRGVSQRLQVVLLSVTIALLADPRRWPYAGAAPREARALSPRPVRSPSGR